MVLLKRCPSVCDSWPVTRGIRVVVLFLVGLLSTAALGVLAAVMCAVSLAATTALIVPGTGNGMPADISDYMQNARSYYLKPFTTCTDATDCTLQPVNYSASFFPLYFIPRWCVPGKCKTWDASVETGVESLNTQLELLQNSADPVVVFGYSQGGAVVSNELRAIADKPDLLDKIDHIVFIGNAYNPDGGFFTRLGFLPHIPLLNISWGPATPVDLPFKNPITSIGFEYDPVMYAPKYWGNPLAMINAVAGLETVHGGYLTPNGNGPDDPIAYGYTDTELASVLSGACPGANCRVDSYGNKYYMIPAKSLPMFDLLTSELPAPLKPFVQPFVDLATPVTRVLVDLGYDWSGDPGKTQWLSPLPFSPSTNFVKVGFDLVGAIGQGIEDVFGPKMEAIAPSNDDIAPTSNAQAARAAAPSAAPVDSDVATNQDDAAGPAHDATASDTASESAATEKADKAAAKAEREAKQAAAKAEREAKKAERDAERAAAKADREAKKAAAKAERAAHKDADSSQAAA